MCVNTILSFVYCTRNKFKQQKPKKIKWVLKDEKGDNSIENTQLLNKKDIPISFPYSEKSFVLRGNTKPYKEKIKELGFGKYIRNLKGGPGWVFSNRHQKKVDQLLESLNS